MADLRRLCGDRYCVVDDGTNDSDRSERVWCREIRGKYGAIYPYGFNGALAVRVESARVAKRATALGLRVVQCGDTETVLAFPPKRPVKVALVRIIEFRCFDAVGCQGIAGSRRSDARRYASVLKPAGFLVEGKSCGS